MQVIEQVTVRPSDVERRTRSAVFRRLGYAEPRAVISITYDPDRPGAVLLHVNSGGNALACEPELRGAGYAVEPGGAAPGHYGVLLRVTSAVTFVKGVRCGGCGDILPDQEGVARDCECARIEAIACACPGDFLDNGIAVEYCPRHGDEAQANEQAATNRGPWYGQPVSEGDPVSPIFGMCGQK